MYSSLSIILVDFSRYCESCAPSVASYVRFIQFALTSSNSDYLNIIAFFDKIDHLSIVSLCENQKIFININLYVNADLYHSVRWYILVRRDIGTRIALYHVISSHDPVSDDTLFLWSDNSRNLSVINQAITTLDFDRYQSRVEIFLF